MAEVVIALDVPSRAAASSLVDRLPPEANFFKVGLELFVRAGPTVVTELRSQSRRVFLDLKLHDIPNTVAAAARAAAELEADLLTIHALGGPRMIEAAREAVEGSGTKLIAVTVLTSLSESDLAVTWGTSRPDRGEEVARLASLAIASGAHGVVASPMQARQLRERLAPDSLIVTPGIRLPGDESDDHAGVATPREAARAGADVLVVGRSVTGARDPREAFVRIHAELVEA